MTRQKLERLEASKVMAAGVDRRVIEKPMIRERPVIRVRAVNAIDEEWDDKEEILAEAREMEDDRSLALEQELYDDEIDTAEEGFVLGYRRERERRLRA